MSTPVVQFKHVLVPASIPSFYMHLWKFLFGPASCRSIYFMAGFLYTRSDQNSRSERNLKWSYVEMRWAA